MIPLKIFGKDVCLVLTLMNPPSSQIFIGRAIAVGGVGHTGGETRFVPFRNSPDHGKIHTEQGIAERNGTHLLDYAEQPGIGTQKYLLIAVE